MVCIERYEAGTIPIERRSQLPRNVHLCNYSSSLSIRLGLTSTIPALSWISERWSGAEVVRRRLGIFETGSLCRDVLFGTTDSFANRLGPLQRNRNESVVLEERFRTPRSNQVKGRASREALTCSGRTMRRRSAGGAILKHPKRNLKSTPTSIRTLQYFSLKFPVGQTYTYTTVAPASGKFRKREAFIRLSHAPLRTSILGLDMSCAQLRR